MGRTGRFFCHEHWGLEPDIITVSKALSGGYVPVGAVLTTPSVFDAVYSSMDRAVVHSSTFGRNQLAMVAGLATLKVMDDEGIVERAAKNGDRLMEALAPLVDKYELLHEVRGKGLMIGLEFGDPRVAGGPDPRSGMMELARKGLFSQLVVVPLFHRHRILTQVAADNVNIIKLLPPLIIGDEEIDAFVGALDDVLADATRSCRPPGRGGEVHGPQLDTARSDAVDGAAVAGLDPVVTNGIDGLRIASGDRVLVTGGAGFIGSSVVRALCRRGMPTWWRWLSRVATPPTSTASTSRSCVR